MAQDTGVRGSTYSHAPVLEAGGHRRRPEIQALRAVAVLLVVLYHLWPDVLHGGFVGVDVFFVISGFLITGQLLREHDRTGRIRFGDFWARRVRRLLPAALVVLVATAVAVLLLMPRLFWLQTLREIAAAAAYVENWVLAASSVDYLAANRPPSAVQHFWSLSVEEQFYLLWPLLVVVAFLIASRVRRHARPILVIVLGTVVVVSLVISIVGTATSPSFTFFSSPARAWEFGAGGLLSVVAWREQMVRSAVRSGVAWASWILILAVGWFYNAQTPFPGIAAVLPVVGALGVMWAGAPADRWSPTRIASLRPVQLLGDMSYSLYLWHWPLIVVAPFVLGYSQLAFVQKSVLLVMSIVLGWASWKWVEGPARRAPWLAGKRPRRSLLAAAASIVVVGALSLSGTAVVQAQRDQDDAARTAESASPCFGAASLDPAIDCAGVTFPVISPDPAAAPDDSPDIYFRSPPCLAPGTAVVTCKIGPAGGIRVALIGDSHAAQWEPALAVLARENHWTIDLYLKTNCVVTDARRGSAYADCGRWSNGVESALAAAEPYQLVITGFFAENLDLEVDAGTVTTKAAIAGFRAAWQPLIDRGARIVVIADTPHMRPSTTVCVAEHGADSQCDVPRSEALGRPDLQIEAAKGMAGVGTVDMTSWFCPDSCRAVVGGVALHTDPFHMTKTYSATLSPYLGTALRAAAPAEAVP